MYQDLKERMDKDITQLRQTKHDLELRLCSVVESHQDGISGLMVEREDFQSTEPLLSSTGLPNLMASEDALFWEMIKLCSQ